MMSKKGIPFCGCKYKGINLFYKCKSIDFFDFFAMLFVYSNFAEQMKDVPVFIIL